MTESSKKVLGSLGKRSIWELAAQAQAEVEKWPEWKRRVAEQALVSPIKNRNKPNLYGGPDGVKRLELLEELARTISVWQKAVRPFHLKSDVACALDAIDRDNNRVDLPKNKKAP